MQTTFKVLLSLGVLFVFQLKALAYYEMPLPASPKASFKPLDKESSYRNSPLILRYEDFLKAQDQWIKRNSKVPPSDDPGEAAKRRSIEIETWLKTTGGVTDGGGNKVGTELFDYWVKFGTQSVPIESLVQWNPELQDMLKIVNDFSPDAPDFRYKGWYNQIMVSASKQKWVLDSKPIINTNCWNLSASTSTFQEVVGCNGTHEVKINGYGLFAMTDESQAGFIMHELLLSWAKDNFGIFMSKYDLEEAVREINVAIRDRNFNNIRDTIRKYIPRARVLTAQEIKQLIELRTSMFFAGALICRKESVPNADFFKTASLSPLVQNYLGAELEQMVRVLNAEGTDSESLARMQFCYNLKIYTVTSTGDLSHSCRISIDTAVDKFVATFLSLDRLVALKERSGWAHSAAAKCYENERLAPVELRDKIYLEALDYFEKSSRRYNYFQNQAPYFLP